MLVLRLRRAYERRDDLHGRAEMGRVAVVRRDELRRADELLVNVRGRAKTVTRIRSRAEVMRMLLASVKKRA